MSLLTDKLQLSIFVQFSKTLLPKFLHEIGISKDGILIQFWKDSFPKEYKILPNEIDDSS